MIPIICVSEDEPSLNVMEKMLDNYRDCFIIENKLNTKGSPGLYRNIQAYIKASAVTPYFIITDLDKNECAPSLLKQIPHLSMYKNLLFRIAVHEIEAWLMADRNNFADFTGISFKKIPSRPDEINVPKVLLFSLLQKTKKKFLIADMVPKSGAKIGPYYNKQLENFIWNNWDINTAKNNSPSLQKACLALDKFADSMRIMGSI